MIIKLMSMEQPLREDLRRSKDLGKFKDLIELKQELKLDLDEIKLLEFFNELMKQYHNTLFCLPEVAKWDMKGNELLRELCKKLYKAFRQKNDCKKNGINLAIVDSEKRDDLSKSFNAGKQFEALMLYEEHQEIEGIPIKFAVWDHLAGMTDNYLIKKYEELTFKQVELR